MTNPSYHYTPDQACCDEALFIHETAYVDEPCQIGHGTYIMHFSHVMAHSIIGHHCQIGHHVTVSEGVVLGNNVKLMHNTVLTTGVILEEDVVCGPSTVFAPLKHIRGQGGNISTLQPTLIKRGTLLGPNTTVANGFTVGQYSVVEAGSVVDRNIPDFALVCGNPVQFVGWRCVCGSSLQFTIAETTTCPRCSKKYARQSPHRIVPLTAGGFARDSYIQPRSSIRTSERHD